MAKHTQGPWTVVTPPTGMRLIHATEDEQTFLICYVIREEVNDLQAEADEANANLIAAAPELLQRLQEMTGWVNEILEINSHHTRTKLEEQANLSRELLAQFRES